MLSDVLRGFVGGFYQTSVTVCWEDERGGLSEWG